MIVSVSIASDYVYKSSDCHQVLPDVNLQFSRLSSQFASLGFSYQLWLGVRMPRQGPISSPHGADPYTGGQCVGTSGREADWVCVWLQWGTLQWYRQSLKNLQTAMQKTRKLCAIMIDSIGREIFIHREYKVNDQGWPKPQGRLSIKSGRKVNPCTLYSTETTLT